MQSVHSVVSRTAPTHMTTLSIGRRRAQARVRRAGAVVCALCSLPFCTTKTYWCYGPGGPGPLKPTNHTQKQKVSLMSHTRTLNKTVSSPILNHAERVVRSKFKKSARRSFSPFESGNSRLSFPVPDVCAQPLAGAVVQKHRQP